MQLKPLQRGYTLIELLVSVSIFAIIMLAATAAYFSFLEYSRQAQTKATIINSLFFTIDTIGRELRTGVLYTCPNGCNGGKTISFIDANGCTILYDLNTVTNRITRAVGGSCTAVAAADITDPAITISALQFYVRGQLIGALDRTQPMVTVVIAGSACVPNTDCTGSRGKVDFQIETGATQRVPDL